MRDWISTVINGKPLQLRGASAFASLSDLLRQDLGLVGTKVVCAEGDCGSCTVLVGRPRGSTIGYRAVCSCLMYGGQLDGCHVVTVEGLKYDGQPNPVQEAMVRWQGTQCGYCTPGFVVALCGMLEAAQPMTDATLRRGLTGNLCRCTGYEPILRAGLSVDANSLRSIASLYPPADLLPALSVAAATPVQVTDGEKVFYKPVDLADAVQFRVDHPACTVLAGGTDLGVQLNKGLRPAATTLGLAGLAELGKLTRSDMHLSAGATVPLAELESACAEALPAFSQLLDRFGSPLIKNAGTVGGNIGTGSPIGDTLPALFVLHAAVELTGTTGSRRVDINDFYTGYRTTVAAAGELITRVDIPLPTPDQRLKLYKVSNRRDLDISTFSAAFLLRIVDDVIREVRIAYGGVAATVVRLPKTEASLLDQPLTDATFAAAAEIAAAEVKPISDVRGSAGYRARLAGNVLLKLYHDLTGDAAERL